VAGECLQGVCHCVAGVSGPACDECSSPGSVFSHSLQRCEEEPNPPSPPETARCGLATGALWGVGNIVTLDGSSFDFSGACEYTLLHTFCANRPETLVQVQQALFPTDTSAVAAAYAVAIREGGSSGDTVVVQPSAADLSQLSVLVNGAALPTEALGAATAFGQGHVLVSGFGQVALVRLGSGVEIAVQLRSSTGTHGVIDVSVTVVDSSVACGCSEGLLGYMDGVRSTDLLLPQDSNGVLRTSSALPLALNQFATVPSSAVGSFGVFADLWRTADNDARLFSSVRPAGCATAPSPPPPPPPTECRLSQAASDCCASAVAGPVAVAACIADYCATGVCVGPRDTDPCDGATCVAGQVCVGGTCVTVDDDPCDGVACVTGVCRQGTCWCPAGVTGPLCERCVETGFVLDAAQGRCVEPTNNDTTGQGCAAASAGFVGSTFLTTLDGDVYTFQRACEYTLLHTFCAGRPSTLLQVRQSGPAGAAEAVVGVAIRETPAGGLEAGTEAEVVEVYGNGSALSIVLGGSTLALVSGVRAYSAGVIVASQQGARVLVQLRSGVQVQVYALGSGDSAIGLVVSVDGDTSAVCGCSEGLLGFMDGSLGRELLLPRAGEAHYRTAADLPLGMQAFGAVPSGRLPTAASFGSAWQLPGRERLFTRPVVDGCEMPDDTTITTTATEATATTTMATATTTTASTTTTTMLSTTTATVAPGVCRASAAAAQCCASLGGAQYMACLADFCDTGSCHVVPFPPPTGGRV
jgi:hypothetical protein